MDMLEVVLTRCDGQIYGVLGPTKTCQQYRLVMPSDIPARDSVYVSAESARVALIRAATKDPVMRDNPVMRMAHWAKFPTVKPQAKNLLVVVPAEGRLSHANVERSDEGVVIVINGKKLCSNEPVWWSYAQ